MRREPIRDQRPPTLAHQYVPDRAGGFPPPMPSMYLPYGTAPTPQMIVPSAVQGPQDMLSTPLGHHILDYDPPRGFSIPPFAMYDGSSDPYDHMLHYNQAMILNAGDDRLLCKVFPASLKGPSLAWFHKLPRGSINTFDELWATFVSQYLCSVTPQKYPRIFIKILLYILGMNWAKLGFFRENDDLTNYEIANLVNPEI